MPAELMILSPSKPLQSLAALFLAWKGFLLAVALGTVVGPDYDTSTTLFFERLYTSQAHVSLLAAVLTKWDALYFMQYAREGYVYEQQWAFGAAMPATVWGMTKILPSTFLDGHPAADPLLAISLAHCSHFFAVLAFYYLTKTVSDDSRLAFVAAALHVVSPAGVFLSAPYAESPFASMTFTGYLLFALGLKYKKNRILGGVLNIIAGVIFGLATAFRTNGLLNGVLFAFATLDGAMLLVRKPTLTNGLFLSLPLIGGICVALGSTIPQAIAWIRYCHNPLAELGTRPWCSNTIPSIYTFVQEKHWNVGFLRYWLPNHVPLFLLAAPTLIMLIRSGIDTAGNPRKALSSLRIQTDEDYQAFIRTLAAIQTLLALLAITNYHVQIITRMSSAYPVWYWWTAERLANNKVRITGRSIVVLIFLYATIQSGLYASFLPPA